MLKVLHVNDGDLDDPRIVNAAITGTKNGYAASFCGIRQNSRLTTTAFTDMKWINGFPAKARIARRSIPIFGRYWPWYPYPAYATQIEKELKHVIEEVRPDIIHAHNIFAAHYLSTFGIPMVLDDHELYSVYIHAKYESRQSIRDRVIRYIMEKRWREWERELGEEYPIITVNERIAEHHRSYCKNVFVVPNYPTQDTIRWMQFNEVHKNELCSVYIGTDTPENPTPVRDIRGLYDLFAENGKIETGMLARIGVSSPNTSRIRSFGFLPMEEAYKIMQEKCHIGLVPWHRHWFHDYCTPNKVCEYAHCGLWLIITDDISPIINEFRNLCDTIKDYDELSALLGHYNANPDELNAKRRKSLKYAQDNLIWEKEEHKILDAYKKA